MGGPILNNRLFFFAGYEGWGREPPLRLWPITPSAAAWAQAVPAIKPLQAAFPKGQFASANPLFDVAVVQGPGSVNEDSGNIRLDYLFNEKYKLYARYSRNKAWA